MAGMKLYEATDALHVIDEWLEESGGELTPEIEQLLNEAEGSFTEKVERVALKIRAMKGTVEIIKAEEERLESRRKARENGVKNLMQYLADELDRAGKTKVEAPLVTVAIQLNNPSLVVPETSDLRELFLAGAPGIEIVPESLRVNKRDVLDKVKQYGESILPADWSVVRTPSLRIR